MVMILMIHFRDVFCVLRFLYGLYNNDPYVLYCIALCNMQADPIGNQHMFSSYICDSFLRYTLVYVL